MRPGPRMASRGPRAGRSQPAAPLQELSVSPAAGTKGVNGTDPITVQFSVPLAANSPMPTLSPQITGSWQVEGDTAVFTPAVGWLESTKVTVKIPGGPSGMISIDGASAGAGGLLACSVTQSFTTGSYSTLRLQQLLSQLGYLPLSWTQTSGTAISSSDAKAQLAAAYEAPSGSFSWNGDYPSELTNQWSAGSDNILDVGAVRAFESVIGLTMDGVAGQQMWSDLLSAVGR